MANLLQLTEGPSAPHATPLYTKGKQNKISIESDGKHVRDKLPAALQAHLIGCFLDQGAQLAPCPLDTGSQIFEKLFEIVAWDRGQLFGRQQGDTAAQLA